MVVYVRYRTVNSYSKSNMSPTTLAVLIYKGVLTWEEVEELFPGKYIETELHRRVMDEYESLGARLH